MYSHWVNYYKVNNGNKSIARYKGYIIREVEYFQYLESKARQIFKSFDYDEIRTPIFELTELFVRGIGEETDIVSKEMYTFEDKKGRSITLRPEGTAPVVRALIEHNLLVQKPIQKFYYIGPMFRYERPQQGRQRQFHQIGVEFFGVESPTADAEVIYLFSHFLSEIGFPDNVTKINNIGCRKCRPEYIKALRNYLLKIKDSLCEDCIRRAETNPMRVLDCKNPECISALKNIPVSADFVCKECKKHFDLLKLSLDKLNLQYEIFPHLVRGFDYYTKTVFETTLRGLGAQDAVLGGGRYDDLVEDLGGNPTPAVGASFGVERLIIALQANAIKPDTVSDVDIYFLCLSDGLLDESLKIVTAVRNKNLRVRFDCAARSMKSGLRQANAADSQFVFILGEDEFKNNQIIIKHLKTGEQKVVSLNTLLTIDNFIEFLEV